MKANRTKQQKNEPPKNSEKKHGKRNSEISNGSGANLNDCRKVE
jgi:hypothetical protein